VVALLLSSGATSEETIELKSGGGLSTEVVGGRDCPPSSVESDGLMLRDRVGDGEGSASDGGEVAVTGDGSDVAGSAPVA